jgi:hypothetical protein
MMIIVIIIIIIISDSWKMLNDLPAESSNTKKNGSQFFSSMKNKLCLVSDAYSLKTT